MEPLWINTFLPGKMLLKLLRWFAISWKRSKWSSIDSGGYVCNTFVYMYICIDEVYVSVPCINVCINIYTHMYDRFYIHLSKILMSLISNCHTLFCHHIYLDKCSYPLSHQTHRPQGHPGWWHRRHNALSKGEGTKTRVSNDWSCNLPPIFKYNLYKNLRIFSVENYTSMPDFIFAEKMHPFHLQSVNNQKKQKTCLASRIGGRRGRISWIWRCLTIGELPKIAQKWLWGNH